MILLPLPITTFICIDYRENLVDLPGNLRFRDVTLSNHAHTHTQRVCLL